MEEKIKLLEARIKELERRMSVNDGLLKMQLDINQGFVKTILKVVEL